MADFSLDKTELQVTLMAMTQHRDHINEELDMMALDDPDRGSYIQHNKTTNSVIRKLKALMKENGVDTLGM